MPGLRRLVAWWGAWRERHVQQMVRSDPRTSAAAEDAREARRQREDAERMTGEARDRLRELDALRASVQAAKGGKAR